MRPAGTAVLLPLCLMLLLLPAPNANAYDPFEWRHVETIEFVLIWQSTRTGRYMTSAAVGRTFDTLQGARAAAWEDEVVGEPW